MLFRSTDRLVRFLDRYPFLSVFFEGMKETILNELSDQGVTAAPELLTDVNLLKRHVLKRCIYGVDLNPMAVELAKVSLWLDCFTLGAPLSFLDHHLKCGNSLIGAMARELDEDDENDHQLTFLRGPFAGLLRAAEIMRGVSLLTDVTLSQVQESGELYRKYEEKAKPFKKLLDIYISQHFDVELAEEFLTVHSQDKVLQMIKEESDYPDVYEGVVEKAKHLNDSKRFFHWDLEFPEAFIDLEKTKWDVDGGFDSVIGNPPYVSSRNEKFYDETGEYIDKNYRAAFYQVDLYYLFMEKVSSLLNRNGYWSLIVPDTWISSTKSSKFRKWIISENTLISITTAKKKIFEADVDCMIVVVSKTDKQKTKLYQIAGDKKKLISEYKLPQDGTEFTISPYKSLLDCISEVSLELDEISFTGRGIGAYHHTKHSQETIEARAYHATYKKEAPRCFMWVIQNQVYPQQGKPW